MTGMQTLRPDGRPRSKNSTWQRTSALCGPRGDSTRPNNRYRGQST